MTTAPLFAGIGGHQSARSRTDEWLTPPEVIAALGGKVGLDRFPDALDRLVGVSDDMELIDDNERVSEEPLVQLLVRPIHILRDDVDDLALLDRKGVEVVGEVRRLSVRQHVQHRSPLNIANQKPRASVDHLLIHAENAREREGISLKALLGMLGKDAPYCGFVDAIQAASVSEGPLDSVLRDLRSQAVGHVAISAKAGNPVRQDRPARLAAIATALEAQDRRLTTDGAVADADRPHAVLVDRTAAFALRDAPVFLLRIDEHAISPLVQTSDLHSAKAKQINAIQTPTPNAERHSARATKESN